MESNSINELDPLEISAQLKSFEVDSADYASEFVDRILAFAIEKSASDIHFQPTSDGLDIRVRLDGVLHSIGSFSPGKSSDIVTRLKVLSELLTYKSEVPQEGRIRNAGIDKIETELLSQPDRHVELRVSTFPTLYGERAVVRIFATKSELRQIEELGLTTAIHERVLEFTNQSSGMMLITGPAGGGKTTTGYAMIRHIMSQSGNGRCVVTLEDPIESSIDGAVQSQVNQNSGFDLETGIRSLLRQDPEVIYIGEIRDQSVAQVAFQACMTGHLVISTFHAGSSCEAITRLMELGVEPYAIRSGLSAVLNQRLVRRLCECNSGDPSGCANCFYTGYSGRQLAAELVQVKGTTLAKSIEKNVDEPHLQSLAKSQEQFTMSQTIKQLVHDGQTDQKELIRVFGSNLD